MVEIRLPLPPSVNRYWRHPSSGPLAGRHLVSEVGRQYRTRVWDATRTIKTTIDCACSVSILVYPPDRRRRDLDNFLKSLLDALVHSKVLEDDSLIDDLRIVRKDIVVGGEVLVMIEKLEAI